MMRADRPSARLAGVAVLAIVVGASGAATAQVNCDTMTGPARSDCYIGVARINGQKSEIAAGVARQRTDAAILHRITRKRPNTIPARKVHRD